MALLKSARPKVSGDTSYSSAARAELAIAVAERNAARAALAKLDEKQGSIRDDAFAADERAFAADAALAEAKRAYAVAQLDGAGVEAAAEAVRRAHASITALVDEVAAMAEARGHLPARLAEAAEALRQAEGNVAHAASEVVATHPRVQSALDHVERLERQYLHAVGELRWFADRNVLEVSTRDGVDLKTVSANRIRYAERRANQAPASWQYPVPDSNRYDYGYYHVDAAAKPWADAFAALKEDANAPLPEMAA